MRDVSEFPTKWSVLKDRLTAAQKEVDLLTHQLEGLENTPCGIPCVCGVTLVTEADFARHYLLANPRYLNLGECPNDPDIRLKLIPRY